MRKVAFFLKIKKKIDEMDQLVSFKCPTVPENQNTKLRKNK